MQPSRHPPTARVEVMCHHAGEGPLRVDVVAVQCGRDLTVTVGGGTHYHTGATAVAVPRPSLDDPSRPSASASVICVTGHKEDELARSAALRLATDHGCVVTVSAGIHLDAASAEDVAALLAHTQDALDQLSTALVSPGG